MRTARIAAALLGFPLAATLFAADRPHGLPVVFEPNLGQARPEVRFVGHAAGHTLLFAPRALTLAGSSGSFRLRIGGPADDEPVVTASEPLPGRSSYFGGVDPGCWLKDVPHYQRV